MSTSAENEFVSEIAREIVKKAAPQEMPLFKVTSEAYFKDPKKVLSKQSAIDDDLGFGASDAINFITPIALAVGKEVLLYLFEEAKKVLKTESAASLNAYIKGLFKNKNTPEENKPEKPVQPQQVKAPNSGPSLTPSLNQEQARQVWQIAYQQALALRLSEQRAKLLADSVIGNLVLSPAAQPQ